MKFSVATNFDSKLIETIKHFPVHELYGKLPSDIIGGGRSSYLLTPVNKRELAEHVSQAKKAGIGFNYLLNASCLHNLEGTKSGQRKIHQLLDWLRKIEVSAVTVSNPLLLRIIKKYYPHFKTRISVFTGVDHLRKVKYWEDIGADIICLDSLTVNREFQTLKSIVQGSQCQFELLVNNNCLQSCSLSPCHMNLLAHSSQSSSQGGAIVDHCIMECSRLKMQDKVNYIRSDWIRPEDLVHYESIGIHHFKLVERNLPTATMAKRVQAYSQRHFEGNLLDLIQPYGQEVQQRPSFYKKIKTLLRYAFIMNPWRIKIGKIKPLIQLAQTKGMLSPLNQGQGIPVYIDNRKLDGFIDRFLKTGCRNINCNDCLYCHRFAEKAVNLNPQHQQHCLDLHKQIEQGLTGEFYLR